MKMAWTELEALADLVEGNTSLKTMLAEGIDARIFDLKNEISDSYECVVDDVAENNRIVANSEKEALESLAKLLEITDADFDNSTASREKEKKMQLSDLRKVLNSDSLIRITNASGYNLTEIMASELSEYPFDHLEIIEIELGVDLLIVQVDFGKTKEGVINE